MMLSAAISRRLLRYVGVAVLALGVVGGVRCGLTRTPDVTTRPVAVTSVARQLGTPHPIQVVEVGHGGRWVVACQARSDTDGDGRIFVRDEGYSWVGDRMSLYLFRHGEGEGEAIDQWLAGSPDGRWVLVIRDGGLVAIDTVDNAERSFPDAGWPRLARLDGTGRRVLYVRSPDAQQLVIYDLAQQRTDVVATGRPIGYIEPERGESWTVLGFARSPLSARDARLEHRPCNPVHDWEERGIALAPGLAWIDLETGRVDDSTPATTIAHVEGRSVARASDGSWQWGAKTIVPAACAGVLDALVATPFRLVVSCRDREYQEMFGPDMHVALQGSYGHWYPDPRPRVADEFVFRQPDMQFVCISPNCFSLADGRRVGPEVSIAEAGPYVLGRYGNRYDVTDGRTGVTTQLEPVVAARARDDRFIRVDDLLVDLSLSPPRAVRRLDRAVQYVDDRGWLLVGAPPPRTLGDTRGPLMVGPLTWTPPKRETP